MPRTLFLLGTGVFWAVMIAALIRREFLPYLEYQAPPSYKSLLRDRREPGVVIREVTYGMDRIGRVETVTEPRADGSFRIRSRAALNLENLPVLKGLPVPDQWMYAHSETEVNSAFQLDRFSVRARALGIPTQASGVRRGGDLVVQYDMPFARGETTIKDFPADMTMAVDDIMPHQGGGSLKLGKRWRIKMLQASLGKKVEMADAYAEVIGREGRYWKNQLVDVFRVEIKKVFDPQHDRTADYTLFIDDAGRVLEQEMKLHQQVLRFMLEEERALTAEEAQNWKWTIPSPD